MNNKIIKAYLDIALKINEGCLFIIQTKEYDGEEFYKSCGYPKLEHNLINNKTESIVIEKLSEIDGATIISEDGELEDYGVTLINSEKFEGHRKRHAFALGTSKINGLICILKSEEDKYVRIFKEGVCITEIDSETKLPITYEQKILDILNQPISQILISAGLTISILPLALPAIITFHGAKFIVAKGFEPLRLLLNNKKLKNKKPSE